MVINMYSYLYGKIEYQNTNGIVIDVNGIGYQVFVPNPFSYEIGEVYRVFVYNHIREDEYSRFGLKM